MTDPDLLAKKLAFIETCVKELRRLGKPEDVESDLKEERFITHTLQIAIQAALDAASHIVSDQRLGEPHTNRELFELLSKNDWISAERAMTMRDIAGFRNVVVHGYQDLDLRILKDIVDNHLQDLLDFTAEIRAKLN